MNAEIKTITEKEFEEILLSMVVSREILPLLVPGVFKLVAAHYNDEILERWENENLKDIT